MRKDGRTWCKATHRMVMQSFVGPRPEGMEVAHLDGDKENNNLLNLQYCTPEENRRHNVINGVSWAGEKHPLRKLSNEAVKEIRERLGRGDGAYRELMHKYGVSKSAIYKAYEGVSWRPE